MDWAHDYYMKSTTQSGHMYIITALISAVKPDMNPISLTTPIHVQFSSLSVPNRVHRSVN